MANQKQHHEHQTSNVWLERYAEFDEGPDDVGIKPGLVPSILHEKRATYDAWGEPPF